MRLVYKALMGVLIVLGLIHYGVEAGHFIGNATPSVPRGIYVKAAADQADYVTFCLESRHREAEWYSHLCSPDSPDLPNIIKRIVKRDANNTLIVAGDTPNALDSRILGPIHDDQIKGYWRPLIVFPTRINTNTAVR